MGFIFILIGRHSCNNFICYTIYYTCGRYKLLPCQFSHIHVIFTNEKNEFFIFLKLFYSNKLEYIIKELIKKY